MTPAKLKLARVSMGYKRESEMKKMLTSSQIALQIGVTKNTIIKMAKAGQIPSIRIGSGHYRFDIDDVKLALNSGGSDQ